MQKNNPDIVLLRQQIEKSLNWGTSGDWVEQDYENLSEKIHDKTHVRLSVSTLKRIWGRVRYESSPNMATLNALAKFLDFDNWRDFLKMNAVVRIIEKEPITANPVPKAGLRTAAKKNIGISKKILPTLLIVPGLLLVLIGLISLFGKKEGIGHVANDLPVEFECRQVTDDLPNSVVFDYDAKAFHSDSVYIQQNWDTSRREKVPGNGRQHTSIYYYPGYFRAKLIVDGQVKKESDVFIKSKGWVGIVGVKPVPIYLSPVEMNVGEAMGISAKTLFQKTGSAVFQNHWVYFTNVREFEGLDPAHFSFSISLRNSSTVEQSPCRKVKVYLLGTETAFIIPLSAKGCISDLDLLTGERWIKGKENDLSAFGCDFSYFQQLSCSVVNQRLKIYLNNKLILDENQKKTIGDIIGLRIGFEGTGEIKNVKLSGAEKISYAEQFPH